MYYNTSSQQQKQPNQQENPISLLISPFKPADQIEEEEQDINTTQPLNVPTTQQQQQPTNNYDLFDAISFMSPTTMPYNNNNNQSPSPQLDLMNQFTNDFISQSPAGSSSSMESQLVSPPQQYYPSSSDYNVPTVGSWSDAIYTTTTNNNTLNNNHLRRSSSVPPHHFHKFKPSQDNNTMYNQFQVTTTTATATQQQQQQQQQQYHHVQQQKPKPLPIQIQRVNSTKSSRQKQFNNNTEAHRRQLDEKLEKVNFDDVTVAELKDMLRERGLSAAGRKAELTNRLHEEYELLMRRGGAAVNNGAPLSPALSATLHKRVADLNLLESSSPRHRQQRLYFPYSPPPTMHRKLVSTNDMMRLGSSVPDQHTTSFLNDQFMYKKKPSCLGKNMDDEQSTKATDWLLESPVAVTSNYHPFVPNNDIEATTSTGMVPLPPSNDIWDDQTLQTFLNQI